jgi:hypothetical protein
VKSIREKGEKIRYSRAKGQEERNYFSHLEFVQA